jgi:hypothetical protein
MGNRYQDRHQYFDELVETSTAFYVEYICRFMPIAEGIRVLEVGCGVGGNLLPFALIGCDVNYGKRMALLFWTGFLICGTGSRQAAGML